MDVSENNGTPKSSMLIGFSIIRYYKPSMWGTPILGNTHILYTWYISGKKTYQRPIPPLTTWTFNFGCQVWVAPTYGSMVSKRIQLPRTRRSWRISSGWIPKICALVRWNKVSNKNHLAGLYEQWKKPWLFRLYRGLYYPIIWGCL